MSQSPEHLSVDEVRKVARLSRLSLTDEQVTEERERLGAVLDYMNRLRELDLDGIEPMSHPSDAANRLDEDEPGAMLDNETVMRLAPDTMPPFIRVPKVLGDGPGG